MTSRGEACPALAMVSKKLVAASSVSLVLMILRRGESYGYAILQRVRELSRGELEWTDGMLYPVLHRMEQEGLIRARWGTSDTGRRRRYYQITEAGSGALAHERREWLVVHGALQRCWEAGCA